MPFDLGQQPKESVKLRVLRKTRYLLERGWSQKSLARDDYGSVVEFTDRRATHFCIMGALVVAHKSLNFSHPSKAGSDLLGELDDILAARGEGCGIISMNDKITTVQPLLEVLDEAINREEELCRLTLE